MKTVTPGFEVMLGKIDGMLILQSIERAGRTCYKSEDKITPDSSGRFVAMLIERGHESVLEHAAVTVRIICDRGVSHELVRHRIASYSQESTRYCTYDQGIQVIQPFFFDDNEAGVPRLLPDGENVLPLNKALVWSMAMQVCEWAYLSLLAMGAAPQEARSVLPNSLKTEIVVTMNLREWRHFFKLRTAPAAHPQMREIAVPLLEKFQEAIPVVFDDIPGSPAKAQP
ncbi:MAG: FAD-dependent thymidylate synthase [Deltaproteobacteria bacterium]|nr:MAG: FAD-dependent thymidylate synthase [Deltaproteobacteria bacterium]